MHSMWHVHLLHVHRHCKMLHPRLPHHIVIHIGLPHKLLFIHLLRIIHVWVHNWIVLHLRWSKLIVCRWILRSLMILHLVVPFENHLLTWSSRLTWFLHFVSSNRLSKLILQLLLVRRLNHRSLFACNRWLCGLRCYVRHLNSDITQ